MVKQVIEAPAATERRRRMSYEEWRRWAPAHGRSEWVDGEVIEFVSATEDHQDLVGFLYVLLSWFTRRLDLGKVMLAGTEMRLIPGRVSREPDVLFVAKANLDRLTNLRLEGPADLAVEIVSDDSVTRDRRVKLAEYAANGVPEYWLLDPRPRRQTADFYLLDDDGQYRPVTLDAKGRFRSAVVPGFWLDPAWFWQDPLPDPDELKPIIAPAAWRATIAAAEQSPFGTLPSDNGA